MDLHQAFNQLNQWITQSKGQLITLHSGFSFSFQRYQIYEEEEILQFEQEFQIKLPNDYRDFLKVVGAGSYFTSNHNLGCIFHALSEIQKFSSEMMGEFYTDLFPNLFPVVSLTYRGDEGCFNLQKQTKNFSVFSAEVPVELWEKETLKWLDFPEWIATLVESERNIDIPL